MKAIIFDVDGTLSDVEHRKHMPPDWGKFFGLMHLDPPKKDITKLYQLLAKNEDYAMLVVTARPDSYKDVTRKWLWDNDIYYNDIYMRKNNDFRKDSIVKAEILQKILEDGYEPFLVIDDRPEVVEMWRSYGITTLQCDSDEIKHNHFGEQFLEVLVGHAGVGKSTWAKNHRKEHDIVSTDAIREMYGWGHSPQDLNKTWNYVHSLIKARLENHIPTVLDATNLKQKDRLKVLQYVPKGQYVKYIVIERDLFDCIRDRGWRSEELIEKQRKIFNSQYSNIINGDHLPNVVVEKIYNNS